MQIKCLAESDQVDRDRDVVGTVRETDMTPMHPIFPWQFTSFVSTHK